MHVFDPRYKLKVHILQIILINIVVGISVPQLFLKGQPRTRANTIALGMVSLCVAALPSVEIFHADSFCLTGCQIHNNHLLSDLDGTFRTFQPVEIIQGLCHPQWLRDCFLGSCGFLGHKSQHRTVPGHIVHA